MNTINKKRVLIIAANDMGKSGVPSVFMSIVRLLSDEYLFDIVITREDYYYKDEFLSYGGSIYLIKEKSYSNKIKRIWYRLFGYNRQIKKRLGPILSNNNYEIIHSFKEVESEAFFNVAKNNGIQKRIIHINRMFFDQKGLVGKYLEHKRKQSIILSTHQIAVSNQAGKSFYKKHPFTTIYNTYDEKTYHYKENNSKELRLLQVGTMLPLKNQLFTIEVFKKIHEQYPNSSLSFIASIYDKKYYQKCLNLIEHYGISKNVVFLPFNIKQEDVLSDTSFVLLPSDTEGLPLVAIESQACGIHVFASQFVPKEVSCDNIDYLELNVDIWVNSIINYYKMNNNNRKKSNTAAFSNNTYKSEIKKLYNIWLL